jgi:hypothetical protein
MMMREQNSFVIPERSPSAGEPGISIANQSRDSGAGALRRPGMTG